MNTIWQGRKSPLDSAIAEQAQRSVGAVQEFFSQLESISQQLRAVKTERQERIREADAARFEALSYSAKRTELARGMRCEPDSYKIDDVLGK